MNQYSVKGNVSRDFRPLFFHDLNPSIGPDKPGKKIFDFGFDFAEVFDHRV